MIAALLDRIQHHPAFQHGIFTKLAARELPPPVLTAFLQELGAFCEMSRPGHGVAATLHRHTFEAQAELAAALFKSEEGHGPLFADMAARLLKDDSEHARQAWGRLTEAPKGFSEALSSADILFYRRRGAALVDAMYSLGAMLPLEMAANRQIIPGLVGAFVTSGFYGVALVDLPYLVEHAGEAGAEHAHEETILALLRSFEPTSEQRISIELGCLHALEVIWLLYEKIGQIIQDA